MSQPWSEQRERLLTVAHHTCLYLVVGLFAGTVGGAIRGNLRLTGLLFALTIAAIGFDVWVMNILNAIRGNKPLGDRRLMTHWTKWPHLQEAFRCACGNVLNFTLAVWSPNDGRYGSDPGGGRWCIICQRCGRGHFKFNMDPPSGPRKDAA
jgi:hypothetical protein